MKSVKDILHNLSWQNVSLHSNLVLEVQICTTHEYVRTSKQCHSKTSTTWVQLGNNKKPRGLGFELIKTWNKGKQKQKCDEKRGKEKENGSKNVRKRGKRKTKTWGKEWK